MGHCWLRVGFSAMARSLAIGALVFGLSGGAAFAQQAGAGAPAGNEGGAFVDAPPANEAAPNPAGEAAEAAPQVDAAPPQAGDMARMEQDFSNFLHFSIIGQFDMAQGVARSLLSHPDLNPLSDKGAEKLLELSEEFENSLDTLLLLVENEKLSDETTKILDLIYESHRRARMDPVRIKTNLERLAGAPNQRAFAMDRLLESGEYAVPWMLEALVDPDRARLEPFIIRALPVLGRSAVNPLVQALSIENDAMQRVAAQALGRIGYPQALPYLKRLTADPQENPAVQQTAAEAIDLIVKEDPGLRELAQLPAEILFAELAEQYWMGVESVSPDPREPVVNVWFPGGRSLVRVEVVREIYNPIMCMRCCESSLELVKDQPAVAALWVAANFRREARLGLDVQSEEPAAVADLTRPPQFPRSVYFARSAGPDVTRLVLSRGIHDLDRDVALGAIAALSVTAGPAAMTSISGPDSMSLVEALQFPDMLVRIKAALAVGRSMPQQSFRGSDDVIRVLATALALTGKQFFVLVEPDPTARDRIATAIAQKGATVIAAARLDEALSRAARELPHLDGIFIASDLKTPYAVEAVRLLGDHERFALTPVMVYIKAGDNVVADRVNDADPRVGTVFVVNGNGDDVWTQLVETLSQQYPRTAAKYGYTPLAPEQSLNLAMQAAVTLRDIALRGTDVFDPRLAEQPLINALGHPSEQLRVACLRVLALLDSPVAQRAIGAVALSKESSEELRMAAFGALADSGRHFGARLEEPMLQVLVRQALELPNLTLRTAASQALGALNPPTAHAATVILAQPSKPILAPQPQTAQAAESR